MSTMSQKVRRVILTCLSFCLCVLSFRSMSSSGEETESPICLQSLHQWAHFPHIHFGLMPSDQPVKKTNMRQQEGEDVLMKDGFFTPANVGVSPY
ncbi:hypothetical protein Patl1_00227 [Pistacia atlantica]|uniref:Uncharacterized protein n=1 Tax=Pistacia atlantica TaxID=434234 RepID=A0ACC1C579_9ROSI|nr:hypothetical protein Patl1_00227 [Pistacia atlantica]